MKLVLISVFSLFLGSSVSAQEPASTIRPADAIPGYLEYGDISFRDERALLDHWASQFRLSLDSVIYIFAYSGRRTCEGEAGARAIRAKNYLVRKHGIEAGRVIWKDGGFRENLSIELWLRTRKDLPPAAVPTVDPADVDFIEGCKRARGRRGKL
jgi:hypothetical protein